MAAPLPFQEFKPLEARLVTKTSLSEPKKAIALLILLWYANGKPGFIEYGKNAGANEAGGILDDSTVRLVEEYAQRHFINHGELKVCDLLKGNPLFESQMEVLNAAFELIWHLASFQFVDASLNRTAERTKRDNQAIRYRKRILYSTNLDLIDAMAEADLDQFIYVLFSWLSGGVVDCDKELECRLVRMLTVFSEAALFKTSKGESGRIFNQGGIYGALLGGERVVEVVDPGEEAQGTTRILKAAIRSGLNFLLAGEGSKITRLDGIEGQDLKEYAIRAKTGIELASIKIETTKKGEKTLSVERAAYVNEPHNLIFFGAPGTGKSTELNALAKANFSDDSICRVTFYPDYTYSQFVGCYKPFPMLDENGRQTKDITYDFVPGPFLRTYVQAVQNPSRNYLLIVEEINRANPAAVFGDVFQLLDRDSEGRSVYDVAVPEEMRLFFKNRIPEYHTNDKMEDPEKFAEETNRLTKETERISLPPNMYIWATMNSADQGVFLMDTAFKRRWDFRYIGINYGEDTELFNGEGPLSEKRVKIAGRLVVWNDLRKRINALMIENGINEDKLLGPFFVSPDSLNEEHFADVFKDKVLLYLYEDAGKMKRKGLFDNERATYSDLCDDFDKRGVAVFKGFSIDEFNVSCDSDIAENAEE